MAEETHVAGIDIAAIVGLARRVREDAVVGTTDGQDARDARVRTIELADSVVKLLAEIDALRGENARGRDACQVLSEMMEHTHKESRDDTGFSATGLAVDMTMGVLVDLLDDPRAKNFVSFDITRRDETVAVVTVQRPTCQTPVELLRAAEAKIARMEAAPTTANDDPARAAAVRQQDIDWHLEPDEMKP